VKLAHNIASTNEFAVDIDLRDRWPIAESLDLLAQLRVAQHVDRTVRRANLFKDLHSGRGKAALREIPVALHEDADLVAGYGGLNPLDRTGHTRYLRFLYCAGVKVFSARACTRA